jgi:CspA family cold shock protein
MPVTCLDAKKMKEESMLHGNVKWYDKGRGIGTIEPQDGEDILVDIAALRRSGIDTLKEGQLVAFDLEWRRGQMVAEDLKVL